MKPIIKATILSGIALMIVSINFSKPATNSVANQVKIPTKIVVAPKKDPIVETAISTAPITPVVMPEPAAQSAPIVANDHASMMAAAGIAPSDFGAVDYIVSHESSWCPFKHEGQWGTCPDSPSYTDGHAYGLCQALPGTKMASAGDDWLTNPITQLKWCNSYAYSRYGGWWPAQAHWEINRVW